MFFQNHLRPWFVFFLAWALFSVAGKAFSKGVPLRFYRDYAKVLRTYVDKKGLVNYKGLLADRGLLDKAAREFGDLNPKTFKSWREKDQIAFYLNAYNARTLQAILDHYPVKSIKEIPGVWDQSKFKLTGQNATLDYLEHEILRKKFAEPRIHMALVCASRGCPPLRNKPYLGYNLDALLEDHARRFFRDKSKFHINRATRTAYFSLLFKWYGEDFIKGFETSKFAFAGKKESALLNFAGQHASLADRKFLNETKDLKIRYLDYDWSLNEKK